MREQELDPELYYPKEYTPELLEFWPVDSDLVVPLDQLPASLKEGIHNILLTGWLLYGRWLRKSTACHKKASREN